MPRPHGKKLSKAERLGAQSAFLEAYARLGTVRGGAIAAGVSRETVYRWRDGDSAFAQLFTYAYDDACDIVREEIRRRGLEGWDEPVYQGGKLVGTIHRYSDSLLKLMAVSCLPEFRPRLHVHVAVDGGAAQIQELLTEAMVDPLIADAVAGLLDLVAAWTRRRERHARLAAGYVDADTDPDMSASEEDD